jgi:hypothetical protein
MTSKKKRLNRFTRKSDKKGVSGLFEKFIRTFRQFSYFIIFSLVISVCFLIIGIGLIPSTYLFTSIIEIVKEYPLYFKIPVLAISLAISYLLYGYTIIFLVPAINWILRIKLKPFKCIVYSLEALPWFIHNALTYIVRYTFLELFTPSPFSHLFFRMMGMKIGKNSIVNTTRISDPSMIEIGDNVTLGGSTDLVPHYSQKGILILGKIQIENGANIGLRSMIFGNSVIEKNASVKPGEIILPKSTVKMKEKQDK